jgi:hypothetical protein
MQHWAGVMAAFTLLAAGLSSFAQENLAAPPPPAANAVTNSAAEEPEGSSAVSTIEKTLSDLRLGPFNLHPRLSAGFIYDDNILLVTTKTESDFDWIIQPSLQAVAGDDAALVAYRDQNYDVLGLSPGSLIIQQPEAWPGTLLLVDYGPRFQIFDKYSVNNSIDEFGTLNLLMPFHKLILGVRQDYQFQKTELIEFNQRATVESYITTLSAAYQFGDKASLESDFHRLSVGYNQTGLTGYSEYNTEDWFNYNVAENLPVSLGALAGWDGVVNHQDQTYEQLRARARYSYTEKLAFDVSAGGELREYENGKSDTLSPVFAVSGLYRPAERTSINLSGFRQVYASIFNSYNYANTGVALDFHQGITDRFTAGLSGSYNALDFTPVKKGLAEYSGDYYILRLSFEAKIVRHLTGQFYYQFLDSRSQISAGVQDDQAGVKLILSF